MVITMMVGATIIGERIIKVTARMDTPTATGTRETGDQMTGDIVAVREIMAPATTQGDVRQVSADNLHE